MQGMAVRFQREVFFNVHGAQGHEFGDDLKEKTGLAEDFHAPGRPRGLHNKIELVFDPFGGRGPDKAPGGCDGLFQFGVEDEAIEDREMADGFEHAQRVACNRSTVGIADDLPVYIAKPFQRVDHRPGLQIECDRIHREVAARQVLFDGGLQDRYVQHDIFSSDPVCLDRFFAEQKGTLLEYFFDGLQIVGVGEGKVIVPGVRTQGKFPERPTDEEHPAPEGRCGEPA